MKLIKLITCVIVLCSMATLNGCRKDDINETGTSTSPNLSDRGGLAFHVVNAAGDDIQGVTISIALSQYDLSTGTYLSTKITDANGWADFGLLNAGNYYYKADYSVGNSVFHGEGVVQVQRGINITQELTLQ